MWETSLVKGTCKQDCVVSLFQYRPIYGKTPSKDSKALKSVDIVVCSMNSSPMGRCWFLLVLVVTKGPNIETKT